MSDGRSIEDLEADLEAEMAAVCATINAATGRLVALVAQVLASGEWEGEGIHSPSQWVAWRCGLSSAHARSLVAMARAVGDRPATRAALEAGSSGPRGGGPGGERGPSGPHRPRAHPHGGGGA